MTNQSTTGGRRLRAIFVLAALVSSLLIAPAGAQDDSGIPAESLINQRGNKYIIRAAAARVYDDDAGSGLVAIVGDDMYDVCFNEEPLPTFAAVAKKNQRGLWTVKPRGSGVDLYTSVYKSDLPVFEFFDAVCGAFFELGTPIPAPFATGFTTMTYRETQIRDIAQYLDQSTPQPQGRYQNGSTGEVADADGNVYTLTTNAAFVITARGTPRFSDLTVELDPQAG